MSPIEFVDTDGRAVHGLALIEANGQVWVTFCRPWWDVFSWLWFWLALGPKKWIQVRRTLITKVRVRAVLVAKNYIRIS